MLSTEVDFIGVIPQRSSLRPSMGAHLNEEWPQTQLMMAKKRSTPHRAMTFGRRAMKSHKMAPPAAELELK